MKVLLTVASLKASYGGPAVSVAALAEALAKTGLDVGLWAPDGSAMGSAIAPLYGVQRLWGRFDQALSSFGKPSVIHDNGIWLPHNHRIASYSTKDSISRVVSPRGMLSKWARRHKKFKKQVAWTLYQRRDIQASNAVHATSDAECADVVEIVPNMRVTTIPNGLPLDGLAPSTARRAVSRVATRIVLFIGRLYPVKGLPLIIEAWARVRPKNWRMVIAGPDEGGHKAVLIRLVQQFGLEGEVTFPGPVAGLAKSELLEQADIFVLPSHSESFGMAVAEALAAGVPVITTTAAPWPILRDGALGWWVEPSVDELAAALSEATLLPSEKLGEMGKKGLLYVHEQLSWRALAGRYVRLYESCLSGRQ